VWPKNIPQVSDFAKNGIQTPHPMGMMRRTLQKCLLKCFCKNRILGRKTRFSQKSDRILAKFPRLYCKNWVFADYNSEK
jgi:hypothetical protein